MSVHCVKPGRSNNLQLCILQTTTIDRELKDLKHAVMRSGNSGEHKGPFNRDKHAYYGSLPVLVLCALLRLI